MAQEMVKRVCEHCGTMYTVPQGSTSPHCLPCFSCQEYKSLKAMYGRVEGKGYCCRACEMAKQLSSRLTFAVVLNFPRDESFST